MMVCHLAAWGVGAAPAAEAMGRAAMGRVVGERVVGERVVVELVTGECVVATEADILAAPVEVLPAVARFGGPPAGSSYQHCT